MQSSMSSSEAASLREKLIGALVGLSRAAVGNEDMLNADTHRMVLEGLSALSMSADSTSLHAMIDRIHTEKARLAPDCGVCPHPCGRTADLDISELMLDDENVRSLKHLILSDLHTASLHASVSDFTQDELLLLYEALRTLGDAWNAEYLAAFESKIRTLNSRKPHP